MARSHIRQIADEFSNLTPQGRQEYLRSHAYLVKRGVPKSRHFLCAGAWAPLWITGNQTLTGGWEFQAECQLPQLLGLLWLLTQVISGMSDQQIQELTARDLQPITRYLEPDHITTTQAILNKIHDIISG